MFQSSLKKRAYNWDGVELFTSSPIVSCVYCQAVKYDFETNTLCCENGRLTELPNYPDYPSQYLDLIKDPGARGREFRVNIRKYNNILSFGSVRMVYDKKMASKRDSGVYCYKINGNRYDNFFTI